MVASFCLCSLLTPPNPITIPLRRPAIRPWAALQRGTGCEGDKITYRCISPHRQSLSYSRHRDTSRPSPPQDPRQIHGTCCFYVGDIRKDRLQAIIAAANVVYPTILMRAPLGKCALFSVRTNAATLSLIMAKASRIAVRVDGGLTVGMGHVVRSLTLTEALRQQLHIPESRCAFFMRAIEAGVETVREAGYPVVVLDEDEDPTITAAMLQRFAPTLLSVDLYDVGQTYVNILRDATDAATVCLTDLRHNELECDVLANGFVGLGAGTAFTREDGTRCLFGVQYKVLRPQFARQGAHEIRPRVERVLITTGGYDKSNISLTALRALQCHRQRLEIRVLLGPAYQQHHDLGYLIRNHRHRVEAFEYVEEMAEQLRWADLVISAGGDTLYEIAACGAPALVLCHVPHQLETAEAFAAHGVAVNLGLAEHVDERLLMEEIERIDADPTQRQALSKAGQDLVDGHGVVRVAEEIVRRYRSQSSGSVGRRASH